MAWGAVAVLALHLGTAPQGLAQTAPPAGVQARPDCLDPLADLASQPPLSVDILSSAPVDICAPHFQVIELRNESEKALGDVRLMVEPPVGDGLMRFMPLRPGADNRVEVSADDGATWRPVEPPTGRGVEDDPLTWSQTEALPLARLGAYASPDDSVLFRWRVALGEGFGDPFGPSPRLVLRSEARDACGRRVASALRSARIPVQRPELLTRLTGRNLTRGGAFSERVRAAPGDRVEWRIAVENSGEAAAITGVAMLSDANGRDRGDVTLEPIRAGGRRVVTIEETLGAACHIQPMISEAAWGCAPPHGEPGAIGAGVAGQGRASIETQLSASDLVLEQKVSDRLGADRPGALADVSLRILNQGAPAFDPVVELRLPDGFSLDPDHPAQVFVESGPALEVTLVEEAEGLARLALVAPASAAGGRAVLDPDARVELRFGMRRTRPSLLERDDLETTLEVADGCGTPVRARPARTAVDSRRPVLSVSLYPAGSALIAGEGEHVRYVARIENLGDDIARAPHLRLALGQSWGGGGIEGCSPTEAGGGGAGGRAFRCDLGRDLGPSDYTEFLIDLTTGLGAEAAPSGEDGYRIEVEARHEGPQAPAGLERAIAWTDGVGFSLSQRLLTEAGEPRDTDQPIDLGERVMVELDARWFAGGGAEVQEATLTQALPPMFRLIRTETASVGEWPEAEEAGRLTSTGQRRVHWSIAPFRGEARFTARLLVEAIDAGGGGALREASVRALAAFRRDGAQYGVDQERDPAASAAPLGLVFRRPEVALVILDEADVERDEAAVLTASRGLSRPVWIGLENRGAGPGFVDWVSLTTPPGVSIGPGESDGLDNDLDGVVDEPDEGLFAALEEAEGGAERRRWVVLPGGAAASASISGGGRLEPGERRVWPIALQLGEELSPGDDRSVRLEGSVGARPLAERAGARQRLRQDRVLKAEEIGGFLVLANIEPATPSGAAPSARRLRRGDRVEFRASLTLPSGPLDGLELRVKTPPALRDLEVVSARLASELTCTGGPPPLVDESGGLTWLLGDCHSLSAEGGRSPVSLLDFSAIVEDAPGGADAATLEAWRAAEVEVDAFWRDKGTRAARNARVATTSFALIGPSLAWTVVERPRRALDAGDRFAFELELNNFGDAPAENVALRLDPDAAGAEIDCSALDLSSPESDQATGCDALITLSGAISPGEGRSVTLTGRLGAGVRLGRTTGLALETAGEAPGPRPARIALPIAIAPVPSPALSVARLASPSRSGAERGGSPGGDSELAVLPGDRISLRLEADLPEGAVGASAEFAVRLLSADGVATPVEDALSVLAVAEGGALEPAVDARRKGGWLIASLPIPPLDGAHGSDGPAPRAVSESLLLEIRDGEALRAGRRVEIVGAIRAGGRIRASEGVIAPVVEPFVDLAARALGQGSDAVEARVCNRGGAAAYDIHVRIDSAPGLAVSDARLFAADTAGLRATGIEPAPVGVARVDADGALRVRSDATPLAPDACLTLTATVERLSSGAGPASTVGRAGEALQFVLEAYRSTAPGERAGRAYTGEQAVSVHLPPRSLELSGPSRVYAHRSGGEAGVFSAPFSLRAPRGFTASRLSVAARSAPELVWTLWLDLDGDGLRDADEPRWKDGASVTRGAAPIALIAEAELPAADGSTEPWRGHLYLRAIGVSDTGAAAAGAATVALLPGGAGEALFDAASDQNAPDVPTDEEALEGLAARRLMAVDRDCDGERGDEQGQDALFEDRKLAAPGECVIMRLEFENRGRRAVDSVAIEDRPPAESRFMPRSARFAATPSGLISGAIHEPPAHTAASAENAAVVRFDFYGVLGPGQSGAVEYSVRLTDG